MDFGLDVAQHQLTWDELLERVRFAEDGGRPPERDGLLVREVVEGGRRLRHLRALERVIAG